MGRWYCGWQLNPMHHSYLYIEAFNRHCPRAYPMKLRNTNNKSIKCLQDDRGVTFHSPRPLLDVTFIDPSLQMSKARLREGEQRPCADKAPNWHGQPRVASRATQMLGRSCCIQESGASRSQPFLHTTSHLCHCTDPDPPARHRLPVTE